MSKRPSPSVMRKVLADLEVPKHHKKPSPAIDKLNALGLDAICDMIMEGGGIVAIAAEARTSTAAVVRWMAHPNNSARVREARAATAALWDEHAEMTIKNADKDVVEISRARELAFHYRWRAGKLNQAIYGDRTAHDVNGQIVHTNTAERQREIDLLLEKRQKSAPLTIDASPEPEPQ